MTDKTVTAGAAVTTTSDATEQDWETVVAQTRVVAESQNVDQNITMVVTKARAEWVQDASMLEDKAGGATVETLHLRDTVTAAQQPALTHDDKMAEHEAVIVLPSSTEQAGDQAIGLVDVHQVPDDSDDDIPIITFATPRVLTKRGP